MLDGTWRGEVYEVLSDGSFNGWVSEIGLQEGFDPTFFVEFSAMDIPGADRSKVKRAKLFLCDVILADDDLQSARLVGFIDEDQLDPKRLEKSAQFWSFLATGDTAYDPDE